MDKIKFNYTFFAFGKGRTSMPATTNYRDLITYHEQNMDFPYHTVEVGKTDGIFSLELPFSYVVSTIEILGEKSSYDRFLKAYNNLEKIGYANKKQYSQNGQDLYCGRIDNKAVYQNILIQSNTDSFALDKLARLKPLKTVVRGREI